MVNGDGIENPLVYRGVINDFDELLDIRDAKPGHYFYLANTSHMYMFNGKSFDLVCIPIEYIENEGDDLDENI